MRQSDYLRKIIKDRNLTQQALADSLMNDKKGEMGVSRKYVNDLLKMEALPQNQIQNVNKLLNIDLEKEAREIDNVTLHEPSNLPHKIDLMKKDIERLNAILVEKEERIELLERLLEVYTGKIKKQKVGSN